MQRSAISMVRAMASRMALEEPRHLGRGLQEPIGEALAPEAGVIDRAALANAGHDVLEHPALGRVIEHVVRRDGRHASRTGVSSSL